MFSKPSGSVEKKKKKEKTFFQEVSEELNKYFIKKMNRLVEDIRNRRAQDLSINEIQKERIREALEQSKMSPNGPSREKLQESAMKVAEEFSENDGATKKQEGPKKAPQGESYARTTGDAFEETKQKETGIPLFITNRLRADLKSAGYSDVEIGKMTPQDAWTAFKKETEEVEKKYEPEQVADDIRLLHQMWEEAYDRLDDVVDSKRMNELLEITAQSGNDSEPIEMYIKENTASLKPEEKFFLEMSVQLKNFRTKAEEVMA